MCCQIEVVLDLFYGPCLVIFNMVCVGTASLALMKPEPVSDSWTEDMTASMI